MFGYYFNIALIYIVIGFGAALVFTFFDKNRTVGTFSIALVIAVVGSFLGGVIDYFLADVFEKLSNLNDAVNIFPPLFLSFLVLWLFSRTRKS